MVQANAAITTKYPSALTKGCEVPARRYAGRCQHILGHEAGLGFVLQHRGTPLTNNEAGAVWRQRDPLKDLFPARRRIRRKICSRVLSVRDLGEEAGLSAIEVITIATAVITGQKYPDVFNLARRSSRGWQWSSYDQRTDLPNWVME